MPEVGGQNTTDFRQNANVQPAARVVSISAMVKHVSNSGPTATHNVRTFMFSVSMVVSLMIMRIPSSLASESAWKVLVLSSWLLLGRPAVNASESNCAHSLEGRLALFWSEDWPAL